MRRKSKKNEAESKSSSSEFEENGSENEDATSDAGEPDLKRRKSDKKLSKNQRKSTKNDKRAAKETSADEDEERENGAEKEDAASESSDRESKRRKSDKKPARKSGKGEKKVAKEKSDEETEQYEVEAIVDAKTVRGVKHYLIRWKGWDSSSDTWEAEHSLNCPDRIKEFNDNVKDKMKKGKQVKSKKPMKGANQAEEEEWDENADYEVDKIIEVHHKRNGKKEFLVSWKGYPQSQDSWVDEEDMDCKDLIAKFMAKVEEAKNAVPKQLRENRVQTDRFTLATRETGRRLSKRNKGKQRVQYHNAE